MISLTRFALGVGIGLVVFMSASVSASFVDVTARIEGVYTDTSFGTLDPSFVSTSPQEATASLSAGQGIIIAIDVANPTGGLVDAIFTSLVVDGSQVSFLGGSALSEVLAGGAAFSPTSLTRVAQPDIKLLSPSNSGGTETWVQATAFAGQGGTTGTGPDVDAVMIFFEVTGAAGSDTLDFPLTITQGDAINSPDSGNIIPTSTLTGAVINVPEASSLASAVAALGTLFLVVRSRSRAWGEVRGRIFGPLVTYGL